MKRVIVVPFIFFLMIQVSYSQGRPGFSFNNPSGPEFTEKEKLAQITAGKKIKKGIFEALENGEFQYKIPAGHYRFQENLQDEWPLHLEDVHYPEDNPFVIKGGDVTFWIELHDRPCWKGGNKGIQLTNCSNIVIDGIILDSDPRGNIEGKVTRIDYEGNRIEIEVSEGSNYEENFLQIHSQSRVIPFNSDGSHNSAFYKINKDWGPGNVWLDSLYFSDKEGRIWLHFKKSLLFETNRDPDWIEVYGEKGIIEKGDGLGVVFSTTQAISLKYSKQITVKNVDCYIAKASLYENGGYGNHKWINCRFIPRPGSNRLQGGDGTMSMGIMHGSLFDGLVVSGPSDDGINIHGYWASISSINGTKLNFKQIINRVEPMLRKGNILKFHDIETGEEIAARTIESYENMTAVLDKPADGLEKYRVRFPEYECDGWILRNCKFIDLYQRILLRSGSGLFENNVIINTGNNLVLDCNMGGMREAGEGGLLYDVTIRNNVFIDCAPSPWFEDIRTVVNPESVNKPLIENVKIQDNIFVRSSYRTLNLSNLKNSEISGNIIVNPMVRTIQLHGDGTLDRQPLKFDECENIRISNNTLVESKPVTKENYISGNHLLDIKAAEKNEYNYYDNHYYIDVNNVMTGFVNDYLQRREYSDISSLYKKLTKGITKVKSGY